MSKDVIDENGYHLGSAEDLSRSEVIKTDDILDENGFHIGTKEAKKEVKEPAVEDKKEAKKK